MAVQKNVPLILDEIITQAMHNASDIHLEMNPDHLRVRFRIDGLLYDQPSVPLHIAPEVFSRLKVLAQLDIAQNRLPQDGKFSITRDGKSFDIRVATFPTIYGENAVLRILDAQAHLQTFAQLGMSAAMESTLKKSIERHHGFFLVTGPTGSGKTTTLYALLHYLNDTSKHIITIEDPVEYTIAGVTQSPINSSIGFDFAQSVRCMLRQDPDIVLIGEMRDKETAAAAIEASLTGHMVLSTLHTKDAISTIFRLIDMRVERFLIAASLSGVMAQRLVRKICSECKETYVPTKAEQKILNAFGYTHMQLYKGNGCAYCMHTGYKGRIGIFELLLVDDTLSQCMYDACADQGAFKKVAQSHGYKTLIDDACEKLSQGMTTMTEIVRIVI